MEHVPVYPMEKPPEFADGLLGTWRFRRFGTTRLELAPIRCHAALLQVVRHASAWRGVRQYHVHIQHFQVALAIK